MREVEVAIIGAGSAGLYALSQVKKQTDDFVLINGGEHGTTCARVGCMPSKALIQIAEYYHGRNHFQESGINGSESLSVDIPTVMERVRSFRNRFVGALIKNTIEPLGEKRIDGYARFVAADTLEVNGEQIKARKIIIATGSTPLIPKAWEEFGEKILTTDGFFEQKELPGSMGVIGLGVIGLEIGQALGRLGVKVHGFGQSEMIGGISDPDVSAKALELISRDFPMTTGESATLSAVEGGIKISTPSKEVVVEKVIASIGRVPNTENLALENAGIKLDSHGAPLYDPHTMQVGDLPVYIAGDVTAERTLLHEAGDEGRIAGYNAVHDTCAFQRKTSLGVVFSDPNIAFAGENFAALKDREDLLVGEFNFAYLGRSIVMNKGEGILRIYASKPDGRLLGAEMAIPGGEHMAHHLAWAIEQGLSVSEMLKLPYYHPVLEEGLQSALNAIFSQLEVSQIPIEMRLG